MERMFWCAAMRMEKSTSTIVLPVLWNTMNPKNGSNVLDCVNSGSTNNVFTINFHFRKFLFQRYIIVLYYFRIFVGRNFIR